MSKWYRLPELLLILIGFLSLGLISITDKVIYNFLMDSGSSLALFADLRFPSLILVGAIYAGLLKMQIIDSPVPISPSKRDFRGPSIWLVLTAYFVLVKKVWVPNLKDWIDWIAFIVTGLIAEEILFRGILFDLCRKVFRERQVLNLSIPVLLTSFLFGIQHLSYHHFQINSASIT